MYHCSDFLCNTSVFPVGSLAIGTHMMSRPMHHTLIALACAAMLTACGDARVPPPKAPVAPAKPAEAAVISQHQFPSLNAAVVQIEVPTTVIGRLTEMQRCFVLQPLDGRPASMSCPSERTTTRIDSADLWPPPSEPHR